MVVRGAQRPSRERNRLAQADAPVHAEDLRTGHGPGDRDGDALQLGERDEAVLLVVLARERPDDLLPRVGERLPADLERADLL